MKTKEKEAKKISALKLILIIFGVCILIFALVNLAWMIFMKAPYDRFIKQCSAHGEYMSIGSGYKYVTPDGKYDFGVYSFPYLNFKGVRMSIGNNGTISGYYDENTGETISKGKMVAFAVGFNMYHYSFSLRIDDADENFYAAIDVDKDLNVINKEKYEDEYIVNVERYIEKYHDELQEMAEFGLDMWSIY